MTKKISKELLRQLAARTVKTAVPAVKNRISKDKSSNNSVIKRPKKRSKKRPKKRGSLTQPNIQLHPRVRMLIKNSGAKEKHSEKTLEKFSLFKFREALANGCKKCGGTGLIKAKSCKCLIKKDHSDCYNYCACINEISNGNFILHCSQHNAWYNANVFYTFKGAENNEAN